LLTALQNSINIEKTDEGFIFEVYSALSLYDTWIWSPPIIYYTVEVKVSDGKLVEIAFQSIKSTYYDYYWGEEPDAELVKNEIPYDGNRLSVVYYYQATPKLPNLPKIKWTEYFELTLVLKYGDSVLETTKHNWNLTNDVWEYLQNYSPNHYINNGYLFEGFFLDTNFKKELPKSFVMTKDTTVFAKLADDTSPNGVVKRAVAKSIEHKTYTQRNLWTDTVVGESLTVFSNGVLVEIYEKNIGYHGNEFETWQYTASDAGHGFYIYAIKNQTEYLKCHYPHNINFSINATLANIPHANWTKIADNKFYTSGHVNSLGRDVTLTLKDGLIVQIEVDVGIYFFAYGETPSDWTIPPRPDADWIIPSELDGKWDSGAYVQIFCC